MSLSAMRMLAFALVTLCAAPALAQPAAPALQEVEVQSGLEYAKHDGVALQGDLYVPKAAGKYPVVVAVHGGGWQAGNRAAYASWGNWLSQRGIALFSVTYRFPKPGQKSYPMAVNDVRAAVQFVKANAARLKLDPERVALMGDSAGGHLAALVALAGDEPSFAGQYKDDPHASVSSQVKAVVGVYGVYDLVQQYDHDLVNRPQDMIVGKFLGVAPWENRKLYFEASPASWVTSDKKATSFLLAYGTEDDIVDRKQSDAFLVSLKQAGFFARNFVLQGFGHFWQLDHAVDDPRGATSLFAPRLLRFLQDRL